MFFIVPGILKTGDVVLKKFATHAKNSGLNCLDMRFLEMECEFSLKP